MLAVFYEGMAYALKRGETPLGKPLSAYTHEVHTEMQGQEGPQVKAGNTTWLYAGQAPVETAPEIIRLVCPSIIWKKNGGRIIIYLTAEECAALKLKPCRPR